MKANKLLENIEILEYVNVSKIELENLDILNICDNTKSKKQLKNSCFVCIEGFNFDSHSLSNKLQNYGVKLLVCNKKVETNLPYVVVKNTRKALGYLANNFYEKPNLKMKVIGVVGTNGKTSTTSIIKQLLDSNKIKTSLIGTSGVYINKTRLKETLTTPDPILLNKLFYKMQKAGSKVVVMEISAHAISLNKVDFLKLDALIFSNFSQDHLDFFKTMENYKNVKFSFFNTNNTKNAIINIDDPAGFELYNKIKDEINTKTFGINNNADLFARNIKLELDKSSFEVIDNCVNYFVCPHLSCLFNVYNILSAILTLQVLGFTENLFFNVNKLKPIKGRFNIFKVKNNSFAIIDYAHTPESLKSVLENIKNLTNKNIITVFGAPGNRDETKRELMGTIAYTYCEKIIITSDNPKYENPLIICNEILKGAKEKGIIIEDREKAIKFAYKNLNNNVLLIAGKGSETYQDINNLKIPFCDYYVLNSCIKKHKKQ